MKTIEKIFGVFLILLLLVALSCNSQPKPAVVNKIAENNDNNYKVTFIELGSVRCIPCQQMQPVMKSVGQKYARQVKVVFHDVWTEGGAPYAKQYGIESIPTQVFLDSVGKEYFRHVGFFPEEELIKVLKQKGVE